MRPAPAFRFYAHFNTSRFVSCDKLAMFFGFDFIVQIFNLKPRSILALEALSPKKMSEALDKAAVLAAQEREARRLDKIVKDIKAGKRKTHSVAQIRAELG